MMALTMEPVSIFAVGILLLIASAALAAAIILSVVHLGRRAAGWPQLLRRFHSQTTPDGKPFCRQTVSVGSVRFRRAGNLIIGPPGVYLHGGMLGEAILVPWREISATRYVQLSGIPALELCIGSPETGRISVPPELLQEMRPYLKDQD